MRDSPLSPVLSASNSSLASPVAEIQVPVAPVVTIDMAAVDADTQTAFAAASAATSFSFKVLTVNIHKGFTFFNRKFILP